MPKSAVWAGESIDRFIPPQLRNTFYKNSNPQSKYARNDGIGAYDFPTNGLVLYLPLWALQGSTFSSVDAFKHTATVTGATWGIQGRTFASGNLITAPILQQITKAGTYTFCTWIKPTATTLQQIIFENSHGGADRNGLNILSGDLRFGYYNGVAYVGKSGALTTNWSFVRAMNDAGTLSLYINEVAQTGTTISNLNAQAVLIYFGNNAPSDSPYIGLMGEIILYTRILTDAEGQRIQQETEWRYV